MQYTQVYNDFMAVGRYVIHVPVEQFGYVSYETEFGQGSIEEAVIAYEEIARAFKNGVGLPLRDFNKFFDTYLSTGHAPDDGLELWEQMSDTQKIVINELKKAFKRLNK